MSGEEKTDPLSHERGVMDRAGAAELMGLLAAFLLGLALRALALHSESLWYDEVVSANMASAPLIDLLLGRVRDQGNPAGYYALLKVWISMFGGSDTSIRALSVTFGSLTVPAAWLFARVLAFAARGRLALATMVALNPPLIFLSREARTFAVLTTALVLVAWLVERIRLRDRQSDWIAFTAGCIILVHLHYYSFFFVGVLGVYLLYCMRRTSFAWAKLVGAALIVGLSMVHWLPHLLAQMSQGGTRGDDSWLLHLFYFPAFALVGHTLAWKSDGQRAVAVAEAALLLGVYLPAAVLAFRARRLPALPATMVAGVLGVVAAFSFVKGPIVASRYLCPIIPFVLAILVFAAFAQPVTPNRGTLALRLARPTAVAVLLVASVISLYRLYGERQKDDWRGLVAYVDQVTDRSPVYFFEDHGVAPFAYYDRAKARSRFRLFPQTLKSCPKASFCVVPTDTDQPLSSSSQAASTLLQHMAAQDAGFWVAYYLSGGSALAQGKALRAIIENRFSVSKQQCFGRVCVVLYR